MPSLSIVIPTYRRGRVLLSTIDHLCRQTAPDDEMLVIDQTEEHDSGTAAQLQALHQHRVIRWLHESRPSVTVAMNRGLIEAERDVVVFTDDDVKPEPGFLSAHRHAHR